MDELELLQKLRAMGVKMADLHFESSSGKVRVIAVEFFPSIPALDLDSFVPPVGDGATERPPPPAHEDGAPNVPPLPPAMARVLKRGSVS